MTWCSSAFITHEEINQDRSKNTIQGGRESWDRTLDSLDWGPDWEGPAQPLLSELLGAMVFLHIGCSWETGGDRAREPETQLELKRATACGGREWHILSRGCVPSYNFCIKRSAALTCQDILDNNDSPCLLFISVAFCYSHQGFVNWLCDNFSM